MPLLKPSSLFNIEVNIINKIYNDPDSALREIRKVNEKLSGNHGITGHTGDEPVEAIDFAVNSEVYEEIKQRAMEEGLPNQILNVGATREEIRTGLLDAKDFAEGGELSGFMGEVLGGAASTVAMNSMIQGFSYWYCSKEKSKALEDTVYNSLVSVGGVSAAYAVEAVALGELEIVAGIFAGPIGMAVAFGAAAYSRGVLNRVVNRRYIVARLDQGNSHLEDLCLALAA